MLAMVMLMLFCQISNAAFFKNDKEKWVIENINSTASIYLDPMGDIDIVTSSWNLVVYYDMEAYFIMIEKGSNVIQKMRPECIALEEFKDQCNTVLNNMQRQIYDLKENNNLLMPSTKARLKCAPFEFMGSIANLLFGTMDADDRRHTEETMNNLLENQHNLHDLIKKQASVIDSTANILKKTIDEVNENFKVMNSRLENITELVKSNYFIYMSSVSFFLVTNQLNQLIDECEKIQAGIISLLIDINHGRINTNILKPSQLQTEIDKIKTNIAVNLMLPCMRTGTGLKETYSLLTAKGLFIDNRVVINAKVPLIDRHPSQLFKIIPLPIRNQQEIIIADVSFQYIVYNLVIDSYHLMSKAALNRCQKWQVNRQVCDSSWACEVSPLKPNTPSNCFYRMVSTTKSYWVELDRKGSWLFKVPSDTKANIQCNNEQQKLIGLPDQGILTIKTDCTLRALDIILIANQDIHSERSQTFASSYISNIVEVPKIV